MPTTVARKAVRLHHSQGARAATRYLEDKLGNWMNHRHASLASNARNTVAGLGHYIAEDARDGRPVRSLDDKTVVSLPSGPVKVRFDAILADGSGVAGRVVFWDGPDFVEVDAALIAAVYGEALGKLFPGEHRTTIGIWQARRNHMTEVAVADAIRRLPAADVVRASL